VAVKVRIISDSREELVEAIELLTDKIGQERLGYYKLPNYPGREGEWLLYFTLDTTSSPEPDQSLSERQSETELPTQNGIDLQRLGFMLRSKRGKRGLREVAAEIGTSPSTLSRLENAKVPDLQTFLSVCDWLEVGAVQFLSSTPASSMSAPAAMPVEELSPAERIVYALLASDLDNELAQALATLVRKSFATASHEGEGEFEIP
jgi:transcriptional regulator with XRE-family HTH domain